MSEFFTSPALAERVPDDVPRGAGVRLLRGRDEHACADHVLDRRPGGVERQGERLDAPGGLTGVVADRGRPVVLEWTRPGVVGSGVWPEHAGQRVQRDQGIGPAGMKTDDVTPAAAARRSARGPVGGSGHRQLRHPLVGHPPTNSAAARCRPQRARTVGEGQGRDVRRPVGSPIHRAPGRARARAPRRRRRRPRRCRRRPGRPGAIC